jgi:hypothetical protein
VQDIDWLRGKQPLSLGPVPHEMPVATYINRASEIGWLVLRTFPFLQFEPRAFGKEWREKWMVLDDSFRIMIESLEKMGKKIGQAIAVFANAKFTFSEGLHYHE